MLRVAPMTGLVKLRRSIKPIGQWPQLADRDKLRILYEPKDAEQNVVNGLLEYRDRPWPCHYPHFHTGDLGKPNALCR